MPTHYIDISHPQGWGGQNSDWPADTLLPGQLSAANDVWHRGPELLRREGQYREPSGLVSAGLTVVAGFAADYATGQKVIVQGQDGRFYQSSGSHHPWVQMSATTIAGGNQGVSAFGQPACFALLGDVTLITTNGGTMVGTSGTDHLFQLSGSPSARFVISYKNRGFAAGHDVSADEVMYTAIGATTGLPTPADWYSSGNAGNRIFSQGEGDRIVGLAAGRDEWYVFKPNRTTIVTGSTPTKWSNLDVDREVGMYHRSVAVVGRGLVGANEDGIFSLLDGKIEPIMTNRIVDYWRGLNLVNVSAFQTAWSGSRDQIRMVTQTSAGQYQLLDGVLEVGRPVSWYPWPGVSSRAIWSRSAANGRYDFYRGGSADGFVYRMDQGSLDASATFAAGVTSKIYDDNKPFMDKKFTRAWVFGRSRGAWNISCTFNIHAEQGKAQDSGPIRLVNLDTTSGDVRRASFYLGNRWGWAISYRVDFDVSAAGSIHRVVIEYESDETPAGPMRGIPAAA